MECSAPAGWRRARRFISARTDTFSTSIGASPRHSPAATSLQRWRRACSHYFDRRFMAILDRFRTVPPNKHPDASVRLAYVEELPIDEREQLAAMARGDDDPRVRRAAVSKRLDPPALAGVAREDADESVREQAIAMLRDMALEAFEGVTEAESLAAVAALTDVKTLTAIAR